MPAPQEFVLPCKKSKGPLKSFIDFFHLSSVRVSLAGKQNRYGVCYSLDVKSLRSLIFSQRNKYL